MGCFVRDKTSSLVSLALRNPEAHHNSPPFQSVSLSLRLTELHFNIISPPAYRFPKCLPFMFSDHILCVVFTSPRPACVPPCS